MIDPVIQLLLSKISGVANFAIVSGDPILPMLCIFLETSKAAGFDTIPFDKFDSTNPRASALTLILFFAYVAAADFTKPSRPPLAAAIASWLERPISVSYTHLTLPTKNEV